MDLSQEDQQRAEWFHEQWQVFIRAAHQMVEIAGDQMILECDGQGVVPVEKSVLKEKLTWDLISWTPTETEKNAYLKDETCLWDEKHTYSGYNKSPFPEKSAFSALSKHTQWVEKQIH